LVERHNLEELGTDEDRGAGQPPLVDPADAVLTLLLLGASGLAYYATTTFEEVPALLSQNVTPAAFPRMLLALIAILALMLPFEHRFRKQGFAKIRKARAVAIRRTTWLTIGLVILVAAGAPYLGTVLTMLVICIAMPILWGERRHWLVLVFVGVFTVFVTVIFGYVLKVYFEPGLFGLGLY
jgi:putative tricarboxylic transport membrane protein